MNFVRFMVYPEITMLKIAEAKEEKIIKSCPNGGFCMNPLCMFGCVDD